MLASSNNPTFVDRVLNLREKFTLTIQSHLEHVLLTDQLESTRLDAPNDEDNVKVYLRVRPMNITEQSVFQTCFTSRKSSLIYYPSFQVLTEPGLDVHCYNFNGNFGPEIEQHDVYERSCQRDLALTLNNGGTLTIFAYGQTGSGKTHTISGISSRMIEDLPFSTLSADSPITIQMLEVIGSTIRDLNSGEFVQVLIDSKGKPAIVGDSPLIRVTSPQEAMYLITKGLAARKTAGTLKNDASSRSHFLCFIKIVDRSRKRTSEIKLVDLAGSERNADTKNHDAERIKESAYINSSLMALKNCIRHRSSNAQSERIPVRSSKLTMLLKESLIPPPSKNSKLIMIATVAPSLYDVNHSLDTFRYASALKCRKRGTLNSDKSQISQTSTPMAWSVKKLESWFSNEGVDIQSLILDNLKKKSPDHFVDPMWRFLYSLPEQDWIGRLGDHSKAKLIRQKYRTLFLKKRPSTKATDVSGSSYEPDTLLLIDIPRPPTLNAKSRAQLAMDKLRAKGIKEREKSSLKAKMLL